MKDNIDVTHYNFKGLFKYISTVISWTIFLLLTLICLFLGYYYISVRLYTTKGEKYEPLFSVYTVVSESMEPTVDKFDVIVNTKIDDIKDVKINDVITFISTWQVNYGMTVTHRVVGTKTLDDGSTCLVTRGDNNTADDQTCVSESNVIGVVRAVVPGLGKLQGFLASGFGWLLIIVFPALYILVKDIMKIFKLVDEDKKEKNKKELNNSKEDRKEKKQIKNNRLDIKDSDYDDEE